MKNNISFIHDCFGCGVCSTVCPPNIIDIILSKEGFYEPQITDEDKCINCGRCLKVCSFYNNETISQTNNIKGYATWSKDPKVRHNASSGGTGYEIARQLVNEGYHFCGVKYNIKNKYVEHYITDKIEEIASSTGSKYIQSYTKDAFTNINFKEKNVIVGTPCQIASLRRLIKLKRAEDNFILIDFFCHGIPSMLLWNKYLESATEKLGNITHVSWRNKRTGWHDSWAMKLEGENKSKRQEIYSRWTQGDLFYRFFLNHYCLGKHCTKDCRFKMLNSKADIRIGDLWGPSYKHDDKGVTGLLALTSKGKQLIDSINSIEKQEIGTSIVCEGQMVNNAPSHPLRNLTIRMLNSKMRLKNISKVIYTLEIPFKIVKKLHLSK